MFTILAYIFLSIFALFTFIYYSENNIFAQENVNITSYNNTELGISLQYPTNWSKVEQSVDDVVNVVSIVTSPDNLTDDFVENVNIVVEQLQNDSITLQEYNNMSATLLAGLDIFEIQNFTLANDIPAIKRIYNTTQTTISEDETTLEQIPLNGMQVIALSGNNAYVITYTAEKSKYDVYLPAVESMIDSFMIG